MKLKVFFSAVIITFIMLLAGSGVLLFVIFGPSRAENYIIVILVIMMFILPASLFIWSLYCCNATIIIDETGIKKVRFRKVVKEFKWTEIKTLDKTSHDNFSGWTYISNVSKYYDSLSITKMRLDKDLIYIHNSEKLSMALKKYCPLEKIMTTLK